MHVTAPRGAVRNGGYSCVAKVAVTRFAIAAGMAVLCTALAANFMRDMFRT